jgi:ABC-type branched-subunit amino acid transport system ATPase component
MTPLLEVRSVSKSFGGIAANRNISLDVPARAIVGLIGPNGSGKTTLFNAIVGHQAVDAGSIRFEGREISALRVPQIARLGLVRTFQQTRVYRAMTALQNLVVSAPEADSRWRSMLHRTDAAAVDQAEAMLRFVALEDKRHDVAGTLSFGQQKLLELAMALMIRPKLLLLDEPTAGINPTLINGLMERLRRINAEWGVTLLVIEHNMRVVMTLASRIYCLAHGEVLAAGPPERIQGDRRVIDAYLGAG